MLCTFTVQSGVNEMSQSKYRDKNQTCCTYWFQMTWKKGLLQQPGIIDNQFGSPIWRITCTRKWWIIEFWRSCSWELERGWHTKLGVIPKCTACFNSQHLKLAAMLNGLTEIIKDTSLKIRGLELISINGTLHCVQFFYEDTLLISGCLRG